MNFYRLNALSWAADCFPTILKISLSNLLFTYRCPLRPSFNSELFLDTISVLLKKYVISRDFPEGNSGGLNLHVSNAGGWGSITYKGIRSHML